MAQNQQWLTDWASAQVYTSNEQMSRVCFKEILPQFSGVQVRFGPNADNTEYIVEILGPEVFSVAIAK